MLRINQLAKELGVANQEVIEACEKRLNLPGKSHSSNLTDDQAEQLRRSFHGKHKGESDAAPLAPSSSVPMMLTKTCACFRSGVMSTCAAPTG